MVMYFSIFKNSTAYLRDHQHHLWNTFHTKCWRSSTIKFWNTSRTLNVFIATELLFCVGRTKKPRKGSKTKQTGENSCLLVKSIRPGSGQQQETLVNKAWSQMTKRLGKSSCIYVSQKTVKCMCVLQAPWCPETVPVLRHTHRHANNHKL